MDYSIERIAKRFGVGKHKVYHWIGSGELEAFDVSDPSSPRRQWRATEDALNAFIANRSNTNQVATNGLPVVDGIV